MMTFNSSNRVCTCLRFTPTFSANAWKMADLVIALPFSGLFLAIDSLTFLGPGLIHFPTLSGKIRFLRGNCQPNLLKNPGFFGFHRPRGHFSPRNSSRNLMVEHVVIASWRFGEVAVRAALPL